MIVEIDGFCHQILVTGKKCSKQELKQMYLSAKQMTVDVSDLPSIFCRINKFEIFPFDEDIQVDFVIDTDTDRIYTPSY
ncbi:hypothetical protein ACTSEZ_07535 [Metabacillus sp. JX24]|uniref:hypothetical protein n=1 Tax=Metabacillus sp. JX24 TaxID=3240759 RepID=UPI00350EF506